MEPIDYENICSTYKRFFYIGRKFKIVRESLCEIRYDFQDRWVVYNIVQGKFLPVEKNKDETNML